MNPTQYTIACCMHGFSPHLPPRTVAGCGHPRSWAAVFSTLTDLGFTALEIADSHIRPADLSPERRSLLKELATSSGVDLTSIHVQCQSVIDPARGEANLDYAHRTIDVAAELGCQVFSTGLHQPFSPAQRRALWFWTAKGWEDPVDPDVRALAVRRLRELGRHAAEVGLPMSLEMYEDTYLGTAESAVRLIEEIGLDTVGLNPDIGNLIRLHRPTDGWREMHELTLPYANYWHMKNYQRDEAGDGSWFTSHPTTLQNGLIDYRAVVARAVELGFDGPFLMEQYGGDSLGVCAENRTYLTGLLANAQPTKGIAAS
ncbi:MAG: sugar phosphate isomerase/epimerase family protein [Brevibacterium aurantiacum]